MILQVGARLGVAVFLFLLRFFGSPRCGGIGLNLTAANHVIHFDRCYNPAKEAQVGRGWGVLGEGLGLSLPPPPPKLKIEHQRLEKRNIWVPLQAL